MTTLEIKPPINIQGWADFAGADTLSQLIWDGLSEAGGTWHYMNFTAAMSIWESILDGSSITIYYQDERLTQLLVTPGIAYDYLLPLIQKFQLTAMP
ncbi:hypothetical protein [Undibacterium pigrum]|uniref:Uncharacterized protein n=1 Tax=Undibacterium pigrum TaxID=401470 RepID=A0A318JMS4_9BURK|nr:hypothetical protein [Undibacterium pigrum]PXX45281.1 hypothetical protein DFR42_102509 [Undibacterium pigrum]